MSTTIQPISGFHQFTKTEAIAIMEAKTARQSEIFERELRNMQDKMHTTAREIVKDQLVLLSNRIEQNTKNIQKLLNRSTTGLQTLIDKNTENIKLIDSNIKTLDQNIRVMQGT